MEYRFVVYFGCALLVQIVLPNTVKEIDESNPFIATGEQHVRITRCSETISLFAGDNATFYCNTNITLTCDADGDPAPRIHWFFNGDSIHNVSVSTLNDSLVLKNVSRHSGVYTCVARNDNGSSNASTVLTYIDPIQPKILSDFKTEVFTENFKVLPVTVGSNVTAYGKSLLTIICNVSGVPRPEIEWSRSGPNGKIERKYRKGNTLLLPHSKALSGKYLCKAKNFVGQTQLASNILFVEPIPPMILSSKKKFTAINGENQVFLKVGDEVTTIAGTQVTIQCLASGVPDPKITWYHNGRVCGETHLGSFGHGLSFHNKAIQPNGSGNYTCVANNAFGSVSMTSFVHVIEPVMPYINSSSEEIISYDMSFPTVKQVGGSLKSLVGASFLLQCNAGGIPTPHVMWKKDNLPIHPSKRIKVSQKKVEVLGTMMSDTGWYTCIATNGAGTSTRSTFVHLIAPERPRIARLRTRKKYIVNNMPTPLRINVGIQLRLLAYRELTIYCKAAGFPPPVLWWEKNGEPIKPEDNVFVSPGGGKLVFRRLVPSQNGAYTCVASNAAGQDREKTVVVSRLPYRPKIDIRKSIVSKYQLSPQRNVRVYEIPEEQSHLVTGSDVILECFAKRGYPRAKFKWFKDGKLIRRKTIESFNRSKLKLKNVQKADEGVYKCFARNMLGQHEKIVEIRVKERNKYSKS